MRKPKIRFKRENKKTLLAMQQRNIVIFVAILFLILISGCSSIARVIHNRLERSKYYPIHEAAKNGNIVQIQELLDKSEDIDRKSISAGNTPLMMAASRGRLKTCEFLLDRGANPTMTGVFASFSHTALQCAAMGGHTDVVQLFLSRGIGPDESKGFYTAFQYACKNGQQKTAEVLLHAGANINAIAYQGITALTLSINESQDEVFYWLLEKGADFNISIKPNENLAGTALFCAVRKEDFEKVKMLVEKGANVNVPCRWGTPLTEAVQRQQIDIVRYLLKNGTDLSAKVFGKSTALDIAQARGYQEIVALIKSHQKSPPLSSKRGLKID